MRFNHRENNVVYKDFMLYSLEKWKFSHNKAKVNYIT